MDPLLDPIQNKEEKWRLVVPAEYRESVERCPLHTVIWPLGVEKTYDRVAREYYWKGVYHDVHNLCEGVIFVSDIKLHKLGLKD